MNLSPLPIQKFFGNDGRPLVGGKLFTYLSGTSTKVATYTDAGGLTQNTNPIVLDYRGECNLWIDPQQSYTFVLAPSTDTDPPTNPIWTVNAITAGPVSQDNAATDTGSVNAIALSIPQISLPVAFTRIVFKVANTNTGPVTITINGGTAKNLRYQNTAAFAGGEILSGGIYEAVFDGTQWQLQGPVVAFWRTAAETAASVTPTSYAPQQMVFVERYGAVGDGSTDDSAAIRMACSVLSDYGCLVFQSGKQYRFEPTLPNPYTGTGTQCGYVFNGKTGISVMAQGATFVTTTVGNAVLGLFTFYDCTDCVVYGGTSEGSYTPDSAWTGAYVAFMGLCKNCRLQDGSQRGGYALCCILDRTSTVSGVAANEPVDCYVSGHVQGTRRLCMFLGAGAGHRVDVRAGDVSRFYIEGIRGLTGSVTIRNTDTAYSNEKILITCSNAGVTENIDLLLNCDLAGANFVRFQNQDTSAISFKKIKLRGRVSGVPTSTGVSLGQSSGGTGVTYEDIDLSELQVNVLSGAVRTVYVIPSHAITMRNITLPKVVTSAGTGNTVQIDNTAAATISFLRIPAGFYWRSTDAGSNLLLYSASGTVASMSTGEGGVFDYAGSGATPVQITNAAGLIVGKYRMLQNKTFYVVGSTNVSPYVGDQLSRGFVPAGAVTDATDYSSIESMLVTSGTATVNSLSRIVPGQKVTFSFNGGTPTFANGTNMKLAGGTNFVATQYDTLTLVCIDPPSGGPLETSTMIQAGADVNA